MASWCDKLASTAAMGVRLSQMFLPGQQYIAAWAPILERVDGLGHGIEVEQGDPLAWGFLTDQGYRYGVDAAKVHVTFQHRLKPQPTSGGLPVLKMLSEPKPYTAMLDEISSLLIEAVLLLPENSRRSLLRVGVVSTTNVDESDIPPGILSYVKRLNAPWSSDFEMFNFNFRATVKETDKYKDSCIHNLVRPENKDELFLLRFDWQREFKSHRPVNTLTLSDISNEAKRDSTAYLEELAEGNMFDV